MNYRKIARVVCLCLIILLIVYICFNIPKNQEKYIVKPIWMCWFQGEEDLKKTEQYICLKGWRTMNPDWNVNLLTRKNIDDYIPGLTSKLFNNNHTLAAKSDLLRLYFLEKYGGVWVDASVVPTRPLRDYYDNFVKNTGFFTYRYIPRCPIHGRETISFFLMVDKPNNYLIKRWKDKFEQSFNSVDEFPKANYFTVHQDLAKLYDEDPKIRDIINNMPQIHPRPSFLPLRDPTLQVVTSYIHKRPTIFFNNPTAIKIYEDSILKFQ
jgi:hypothetical protein